MGTRRYNATVGNSLELHHYFIDDSTGSFRDPFAISKVEILDSDKVTILKTIDVPAEIEKITDGKFRIFTGNTINDTARTIYDKWYYTWEEGDAERTKILSTLVYVEGAVPAERYITVEDIREEGIAIEDFDDERVNASIEMASDYIEKITEQWFYLQSKTFKFDGRLKTILFLEIPIISIDSIKINDDTVDTDDYTVYNRPRDVDNPKIKFAFKMSKGNLNVEVAGNFGYVDEESNTPELIKYACKKLTIGNLPYLSGNDSDVKTSEFKMRLVEEKTDGHSYKLANLVESGSATGDMEVDNILKMYRRPVVVRAL